MKKNYNHLHETGLATCRLNKRSTYITLLMLVLSGLLPLSRAQAQTYCTPGFATPCSSYPMNVSIASLIGITGAITDPSTSCSGNYIDNYGTMLVTLRADSTYTASISVSPTYYYAFSFQVWIDFNNDGTFASSESIGGVAYPGVSSATQSCSLSIPAGANYGTHRMRIVGNYISGGGNYPGVPPCPTPATAPYGNARDYKVVIKASATAAPATICMGSSTTLTAAGGASYTWAPATGLSATTGASVTATPSVTTTYTLVATNGTQHDTVTTTVTVNNLPTVGSTGSTTICKNQTATLSGTGAVSYTWTGGITNGVPFTPTEGTNVYTVTGTDANGCTDTAIGVVVVNALPTVGATGGNIAVCDGSTVTLTGTGAAIYSYSGGIADGVAFTPPVGVNTYTITGTDTNSCSNTAVSTVTVNALPTVGTTGGNTTICNGTAATITGTGAASYTYTGGITNGVAFTPATGVNTYTVTGTDANGCMNTATTTITVNALPAVGVTGGDTAICDGAMATLTGTGAASYTYTGGVSNGTAFTPATGTNTYTVTGTDANGCTNTATTTIVVNALPVVGITGGDLAVCEGATVTLNGTGAASYTYTDGIINGVAFTPAVGVNTYTITGTDAHGCTDTATTIVAVNALPTVGVTGGDTAICNGGTVTFSGTGASSYTYTGGVTDGVAFTPATGTSTYTITGTDGNGCVNTATTAITVNPLPAVITGTASVCTGQSTTLASATAGGTWSSSDMAIATTGTAGMVTGVAAGTAQITYTLATGCSAEATITVNQTPAVFNVTGGGTFCAGTGGADVGLDGSETGIYYELYNGTAPAGTTLVGTSAALDYGMQTTSGTYMVTAINTVNGCVAAMSGSAVIVATPMVTPVVSISSGMSITSCTGMADTFTATAFNGGSMPFYQWSVNGVNAGTNSPVFSYTPANGDVVVVQLTSNAECVTPPATALDLVTVTVAPYTYPAITVNPVPGPDVMVGQTVVFTCTASNAGASPRYQWIKNSTVIAGANSPVFITNNLANRDSITCTVTGGRPCDLESFNSVIMHVSTTGVATAGTSAWDVAIAPNPNNGTFSITASLGTAGDQEIAINIVDMVGQLVYTRNMTAAHGSISEQVQLGNTLAKGTYLLSFRAGTESKVLRFVVE